MALSVLRLRGPVAVVGDIHGSLKLLLALLAEIGPVPLIVLGDVCDHGPDTRGVIDLLVARGALGVRGNHEDWSISWAGGHGFDSFALKAIMGGRATLDSYGVQGRSPREIEEERWRVPAAHLAWLRTLATAIDLEVDGHRYWVVHAGVPTPPAGVALAAEQVVPWFAGNAPERLRTFAHSLEMPPNLGRTVIVGHTPLAQPAVGEHCIALDTGAGLQVEAPGLSAVLLPERRTVTVRANDVTAT
jgi:serine/threonine protein phosphatase 1